MGVFMCVCFRDEIVKLKKILQMHLDCDVTRREGQADIIRFVFVILIRILIDPCFI